jgi:hypothetical protein
MLKITALSLFLRGFHFDTGAFNHALVLFLEIFGAILLLLDTRAFFRSFDKLHLSSDTTANNDVLDFNPVTTFSNEAQTFHAMTDGTLAFNSASFANGTQAFNRVTANNDMQGFNRVTANNDAQGFNRMTASNDALFNTTAPSDGALDYNASVIPYYSMTAEEQIYFQNLEQIERFCDRWTQEQERWVFDFLIIIALLIVGGIIFSAIEHWSYNQSVLFCIVSLTTIGMCMLEFFQLPTKTY